MKNEIADRALTQMLLQHSEKETRDQWSHYACMNEWHPHASHVAIKTSRMSNLKEGNHEPRQ